MTSLFNNYKGIHPGKILSRELQKRGIKKGPFAISIQEYPQAINEITKARRGVTAALSLKIDNALGFEEGTMFILQAHYEIEKAKEKTTVRPDVSVFRAALFWDTDITKIDWDKKYKAVIKRVFERGNEAEKQEVLRFYGAEKVNNILSNNPLTNLSLQ